MLFLGLSFFEICINSFYIDVFVLFYEQLNNKHGLNDGLGGNKQFLSRWIIHLMAFLGFHWFIGRGGSFQLIHTLLSLLALND